jgi:hypothetical protein
MRLCGDLQEGVRPCVVTLISIHTPIPQEYEANLPATNRMMHRLYLGLVPLRRSRLERDFVAATRCMCMAFGSEGDAVQLRMPGGII